MTKVINIFKGPIFTLLNNYESGTYKTIKYTVRYKDFERIVEQLQSKFQRIPVKSDFESLKQEDHIIMIEEIGNEQLISEKL